MKFTFNHRKRLLYCIVYLVVDRQWTEHTVESGLNIPVLKLLTYIDTQYTLLYITHFIFYHTVYYTFNSEYVQIKEGRLEKRCKALPRINGRGVGVRCVQLTAFRVVLGFSSHPVTVEALESADGVLEKSSEVALVLSFGTVGGRSTSELHVEKMECCGFAACVTCLRGRCGPGSLNVLQKRSFARSLSTSVGFLFWNHPEHVLEEASASSWQRGCWQPSSPEVMSSALMCWAVSFPTGRSLCGKDPCFPALMQRSSASRKQPGVFSFQFRRPQTLRRKLVREDSCRIFLVLGACRPLPPCPRRKKAEGPGCFCVLAFEPSAARARSRCGYSCLRRVQAALQFSGRCSTLSAQVRLLHPLSQQWRLLLAAARSQCFRECLRHARCSCCCCAGRHWPSWQARFRLLLCGRTNWPAWRLRFSEPARHSGGLVVDVYIRVIEEPLDDAKVTPPRRSKERDEAPVIDVGFGCGTAFEAAHLVIIASFRGIVALLVLLCFATGCSHVLP
eukprot:07637_1